MNSWLKALNTILSHPLNKGRFLKTMGTIFWWKYNQLFIKIPSICEIADGIKIICYPNQAYGSFIVYARWPEYAELNFIYGFLKKGDTYIDVGAHIGDSSLIAASKIKTGKILACEPTPEIFDELSKNIRLNNLESLIIPIKKAISYKDELAYFSIENESEINHLVSSTTKNSIQVQTTTVDSIFKEYSLESVALLKIDVEGFELEVLLGANQALRNKKISHILFEVNPKTKGIYKRVKLLERLLSVYSFDFFSFSKNGSIKSISHLQVPKETSNFLAIADIAKRNSMYG